MFCFPYLQFFLLFCNLGPSFIEVFFKIFQIFNFILFISYISIITEILCLVLNLWYTFLRCILFDNNFFLWSNFLHNRLFNHSFSFDNYWLIINDIWLSCWSFNLFNYRVFAFFSDRGRSFGLNNWNIHFHSTFRASSSRGSLVFDDRIGNLILWDRSLWTCRCWFWNTFQWFRSNFLVCRNLLLSHNKRLSWKSSLFSCWFYLWFCWINWRERFCFYDHWLNNWISLVRRINCSVWCFFSLRRRRCCIFY